jgi:hypothetical protein
MYTIDLEWTDLKRILEKGYAFNYKVRQSPLDANNNDIEIFVVDRMVLWSSVLTSTEDKLDFNTNYNHKDYTHPEICTKQTFSRGKLIVPNKGANIIEEIYPSVLTENCGGYNNVVASLTYGANPQGILQVFKASADNIHTIMAMVEGRPVETVIDNFEYSDTTALRAVWVSNDVSNTTPTVSTTHSEGTKSISVECKKNGSPGDYIRRSWSTGQNWNSGTRESISVMCYTSEENAIKWKLRVYDGANWAEMEFIITDTNTWVPFTFRLLDFTSVNQPINWANIRAIEFYCYDYISNTPTVTTYFDKVVLNANVGQINCSIYDFGATEPTAATALPGSALSLDHLIEPATLPLTKEKFSLFAPYGLFDTNKSITIGNYYGIYIYGITAGSVDLYGNNTKSYTHGKLFSVTGTTLTELPNKSLGFSVFASIPCYAISIDVKTDADTGISKLTIFTKNKDTSTINDWILEHKFTGEREKSIIFLNNLVPPPHTYIYVDRHRPFCVMFKEENSDITYFNFLVKWIYKPFTIYG